MSSQSNSSPKPDQEQHTLNDLPDNLLPKDNSNSEAQPSADVFDSDAETDVNTDHEQLADRQMTVFSRTAGG